MPRWEYCRLHWAVFAATEDDRNHPENDDLEVSFVEEKGRLFALHGRLHFYGSSEGSKQVVDCEAAIARLGLDGWELVSHTQTKEGRSVTDTYFFKRQIRD